MSFFQAAGETHGSMIAKTKAGRCYTVTETFTNMITYLIFPRYRASETQTGSKACGELY